MIEIEQLMPNFIKIKVSNTNVWFSYETAVAIEIENKIYAVEKNTYSRTTSKQINSIYPDERISKEQLDLMIKAAI